MFSILRVTAPQFLEVQVFFIFVLISPRFDANNFPINLFSVTYHSLGVSPHHISIYPARLKLSYLSERNTIILYCPEAFLFVLPELSPVDHVIFTATIFLSAAMKKSILPFAYLSCAIRLCEDSRSFPLVIF